MKQLTVRLWALGAIAICLVLATGMTSAQAAFPGANGLIAFQSGGQTQIGTFEIYVMSPDGTGLTQLTTGGASDPAWSPDGRRIAFAAGFGGNSEIYVMDADGSNVRQITNRPGATDWTPSWSPDGKRLAFSSFVETNYDIWVINADGTGEVNITNHPAGDIYPVWQPDGSKIAFQTERDGNAEIYLVNADGMGLVNVTNNPAHDGNPDWSPDGARLVFGSNRGGGGVDLYTMNADGSSVVRLTQTGTNGFHNTMAAWSPDGTRIVFTSFRDFNDEIYVMNADGSGATRLTNNAPPGSTRPEDWFADWQPLPGDDITPPVLTLPAAISANATSPAGATVFYTATATGDVDDAPDVVCAPPSGSVFAIGTTTVSCTATDSSGNTSDGSFTVNVRGANDQLADLGNAVTGVGPGTSLADKIRRAETAVARHEIAQACSILADFINQVRAQTDRTITSGLSSSLLADATRIRAVLGC